MSIDKITSNKIVPFPNKIADKQEVQPDKAFQKVLDQAQGTTSQVDQTSATQESSKILPIQTNYHVQSQVRPSYSTEQLANDAWNYIFTGKAQDFVNQADKTEFALKVCEFYMLTIDVEFLPVYSNEALQAVHIFTSLSSTLFWHSEHTSLMNLVMPMSINVSPKIIVA